MSGSQIKGLSSKQSGVIKEVIFRPKEKELENYSLQVALIYKATILSSNSLDGKILSDVDLSIFSEEESIYKKYIEDIR